jgi:hypothetical protein
MGSPNSQGQVLVEVIMVMLLIALVLFAALNGLSKDKAKENHYRYQFTQDAPKENQDAHAKKYRRKN